MSPRSLAEMCTAVAISNMKNITGFGSLSLELVMPLLKAVKTADHLHTLELNSDDIYDATADHWQRIIKKDFPILSSKHNLVPEDRRSWHKVWEKYRKLETEANAAATEKLMQEFAAHKEQQDSHRATIISAKESRNLRLPKSPSSRSHWSLQPRQKQTFLSKTRAELAAQAKRFKLATPTGKLHVPTGQIKKAPEALLNEARIALQGSPEAVAIRVPRKKVPPAMSAAELELKRKEARLLQAKNGATAKAALTERGNQLPQTRRPAHHHDYDDLFDDLESTNPPHRGALSVELIEESTTPSTRSASKQPTKPHRGLSAVPGSNRIADKATSPPAAPASDAPPRKPFPDDTFSALSTPHSASAHHTGTPSTGQQPSTATSPNILPMQVKRKKPLVDLCMRTDKSKRPRR